MSHNLDSRKIYRKELKWILASLLIALAAQLAIPWTPPGPSLAEMIVEAFEGTLPIYLLLLLPRLVAKGIVHMVRRSGQVPFWDRS